MARLQLFVLAPVEPEVSLYRLCVVRGCQVIQHLKRVRREGVVGFYNGYVLAPCSIDPLVHGCSIAGVSLVDHAKAAVRIKVFLRDGARAVGAAVVNVACSAFASLAKRDKHWAGVNGAYVPVMCLANVVFPVACKCFVDNEI